MLNLNEIDALMSSLVGVAPKIELLVANLAASNAALEADSAAAQAQLDSTVADVRPVVNALLAIVGDPPIVVEPPPPPLGDPE